MRKYRLRIHTNIRIALCLFVYSFLFVFSTYAQENEVKNLPKYDRQTIHFGFLLGLNVAHFIVQPVNDFRFRDSVFSVTPRGVAGLNLGILSNLRIGEYFDLRFIPDLAFTQRNLDYSMVYPNTTSEIITKTVESTYLEFPLDLKFKSVRIDNYRIYVVGGGRYGIDMISQAKVQEMGKEIVKLQRYDYGYEVGIGFDFYLTYFKFSPELKMYNGLKNLLVEDNTTFSTPLKGLYSKTFMLSFTFE